MVLLLLKLFLVFICQCKGNDIRKIFEDLNGDILKFNTKAAEIAWESSVNPDNAELPKNAAYYQKNRIAWQINACSKLAALKYNHMLNKTQERQMFLLCRGPVYTYAEARKMSCLYEELQTIYYESKICIPNSVDYNTTDIAQLHSAILNYVKNTKDSTDGKLDKCGDVICLNVEPDIEKLFTFSRHEVVLRWLWTLWRDTVGPPMKLPYRHIVDVENKAAIRNGYSDIGAAWREELEIPSLRWRCRQLYNSVRPLYELIHGVVRFFLRRHYKDVVPAKGPIPAHLLGNLWAQNWEPLISIITSKKLDLDNRIKKLNWTVNHMVRRSEDFYVSLGLPRMTDAFWNHSIFTRNSNRSARCHGTAADMYHNGDYRLLYCSDTTFEDFYVIHHEMGHIQYYMAYETQPGLFRQGANTALHESIGDAIMYGVSTPQHLHRLGLIDDAELYEDETRSDKSGLHKKVNEDIFDNQDEPSEKAKLHVPKSELIVELNTDEELILRQALNKIPQIPFSLLIDEYRWKYFEGSLKRDSLNNFFWEMALELQGISPPTDRGEKYFDIGAKFHVPDNTPYIRYFLSSFLQHQIFEGLCSAAVFGRRIVKESLPESIALHRCDIYGSNTAGKLLRDIMSRGSSQNWRSILNETLGQTDISVSALLKYYRPLKTLLTKLIEDHKIPIGW